MRTAMLSAVPTLEQALRGRSKTKRGSPPKTKAEM
jgi:hypothetical protein